MSAHDPVDVLIIGAGAAGAAVAWSLADTRMRILCLEQGDWCNPAQYPSTGRDWEARQLGDFSFNPNRRRAPGDYPVNERDSPIKVANFNGVGGGTVLYAGHFPRFHPSDFRVRSLDGIAERRRSTFSAHMWLSSATRECSGSSDATSAYGSSVSPHVRTSIPSSPMGLASAAAFSSAGTTMRGSPCDGTTRQVSRSSGIAS